MNLPYSEHLRSQRQDAVLWYAAQKMEGAGDDPHQRSQMIRETAQLVRGIPDAIIQDAYKSKLKGNNIGIRNKELQVALAQLEDEQRKRSNAIYLSSQADDVELPRQVQADGKRFEDFAHDIKEYKCFMHGNRVYVMSDKSEKRYFDEVSNFDIEIIQHIEDKDQPLKLVRMTNVRGKRKTFDTQSKAFNSLASFKEMVTNFGNFQFTGTQKHLDAVNRKLFDQMGDGRWIGVLGQQPEGFWAFSNGLIVGDEFIEVDSDGCVEYDGESYYIPSGSDLYKYDTTRFLKEKRIVYLSSKHTLRDYLQQIRVVHRSRSFNAILFTVATVFSDIIFARVNYFPLLFFYGEASTGKDNLIMACQAFFGKPMDALLLSSKSNTDKAKVRTMAQTKNMIVNGREYIVDDDVDEMLKGFWDRSGYTRGNIVGPYSTDTIPVDSTMMFTSNQYPTNDALITRIVAEEFMKDAFDDREKDEYNKLTEMIQDGVSALLVDILQCRDTMKKEFRNHFKKVAADLKADLGNINVADRMIQNAAVLGATYSLCADFIPFPFSYDEWREHMKKAMDLQCRKRETGSAVQRFWDCILAAVRDKHNPLKEGREFKIDGDNLTINFKLAYQAYQDWHYKLYKEKAQSNNVLKDKIKKSEAFKEEKSSTRYGDGKRTSGYLFDLGKIHIAGDLLEVVEWRRAEENRTYGGGGSAEDDPKAKAAGDNDDEDGDELPF